VAEPTTCQYEKSLDALRGGAARALLETSADLFLVLGADLRIEWCSESSREILGVPPAELVGREVCTLVMEDQCAELAEHLREDGDDAPAGREFLAPRTGAGGGARWLEIRRRRVRGAGGVLTAIHLAARDVTERIEAEREREALSSVTHELSAMVEAADALALEHRAVAEVARLVARGDASTEQVMDTIAAQARELGAAVSASVVRLDPDGWGTLVGRAGAVRARQIVRIDPAGTPIELATREARAVRAGNYRAVGRLESGERSAIDYPNGIAAPVPVGGEPWGAIGVSGLMDDATEETLERMGRFAELAAVAISSAEAREQLVRQATTDPLTGLANHRAFQEALAGAWTRAVAREEPLSVAMIDIDHFKRVNDTFGHGAGDEALREVAARISTLAAHDGSLVARVGGEEFAWIMETCGVREALALAEAARRAVAGAPIVPVGAVTISAGVVERAQASGPEAMLELADAALYGAKGAGRNRVALDGVPTPQA
jgi:diguanylate cyclase (GGDEF)-like protein/PAS domain S-box-containing protein